MSIVHVLRAPVGGLFRHVCDLATAQARLGHRIGIVYDRSTRDALARERLAALRPMAGLGMVATDMSREISPRDIAGYRDVAAFARGAAADIVHGHGAKGGAFARLAAHACRRRGAPTHAFYTPHGGSLHYDRGSLKGRLFLALEQRLAALTSGIVFESTFAEQAYRAKIGAPPAPTRVIHNGLWPADFEPAGTDPDAAEFLFVGELRLLKGVDVLISALALVARERPVRLVIVGAGPDGHRLRALAHALGIAERVRFAGPMPARAAFRLGRTLVLPSRAESLPYVMLEAAAAGLPVIATRVGGIPEIAAGTATALVPANDLGALARAMTAALADGGAARAAADELRRAVAARFSVAGMCAAILDFYASAGAGEPAFTPIARA